MNIIPKKLFGKKKRFNPYTVWTMCCVGFVVVVIAELVFFSWYFLQMTATLDAPVQASLETNAGKIKSMERMLEEVETALKERAGVDIVSSDN